MRPLRRGSDVCGTGLLARERAYQSSALYFQHREAHYVFHAEKAAANDRTHQETHADD
jgi:hypothetical protein